jgi:hypothetical protein
VCLYFYSYPWFYFSFVQFYQKRVFLPTYVESDMNIAVCPLSTCCYNLNLLSVNRIVFCGCGMFTSMDMHPLTKYLPMELLNMLSARSRWGKSHHSFWLWSLLLLLLWLLSFISYSPVRTVVEALQQWFSKLWGTTPRGGAKGLKGEHSILSYR